MYYLYITTNTHEKLKGNSIKASLREIVLICHR